MSDAALCAVPVMFSPDPAHYLSLCKTCHRRFDLAQAASIPTARWEQT